MGDSLMADKGIIFSAPMVRALLDGRKTQTRRLIQPTTKPIQTGDILASWPTDAFIRQGARFRPPYTPGDRLYVRENFYQFGGPVAYAADGAPAFPRKMTPCIHMPRWASRLWLAVTDVRVQRLQDIAEAEAIAEGVVWQEPSEEDLQWAAEQAVEYGTSADLDGVWLVPGTDGGDGRQIWGCTPQQAYQFLWNSLHTEPGTRWQDNPWIVAVSFDVNNGNIDGGAHG
jgi:hypothetical protein